MCAGSGKPVLLLGLSCHPVVRCQWRRQNCIGLALEAGNSPDLGGGGESALKLNIRIRHQAANETAGGRKKREEGGSQDVTDGQESDGVQA